MTPADEIWLTPWRNASFETIFSSGSLRTAGQKSALNSPSVSSDHFPKARLERRFTLERGRTLRALKEFVFLKPSAVSVRNAPYPVSEEKAV